MKEKNFWPLGLALFGLTFLVALSYSLSVAFNNPVQIDTSYLHSYQYVNNHYAEIMEKEKRFNESYNLLVDAKVVKNSNNAISIIVTDKAGAPVSSAAVEAILTRPDTSKHDIKLSNFVFKDGKYISEPFDVKIEGRWKIQCKVSIANAEKYLSVDKNTTSS